MKRSVSIMTLLGLLFSSIPFMVGLPFFGYGVYKVYDTNKKLQGAVETEGIVVDNDLQLFSDGTSSYVPVVKFTTETGESIRFTDGVGSIPPDFDEGETVKVVYQPENPREAYINTWFRLWFGSVIWLIIGAIPMIVGLVILGGSVGLGVLSGRNKNRNGEY